MLLHDLENQLFSSSRELSPHRGIAWYGMGFSVPSNGFPTSVMKGPGPTKDILVDCAGLVREGEVLYIMGASGSGKSSTLDSLALRVKADVQGAVWVHGTRRDAKRFREQAKYVEQTDNLFEVLTVEETLHTAAELQVAHAPERKGRVENVIDRLGLDGCRKTKVGGTFFRGCSGGQKRRIAIGVELIAAPEVLLCDEPTSGLDSASSLEVMKHLKEIAQTGVAVICTIHQPGQRVFELADRLLLLSKGRTVYFGPGKDAAAYFEAQGSPRPEGMSAPEYILEEVNAEFHEDRTKNDRLIAHWESCPERTALEEDIKTFVKKRKKDEVFRNNSKVVEYKRSLPAQVAILAARNLKDALRNPAVIYLRFAMYFSLCLMLGIAWLRVEPKANRIQDLQGAVFFANSFLIFMSIAVLPVYINERAIVTRERLNGSYSVAGYMLGHFIVEAAMLAVLSLACTAVLYPLVNLNPDWGAGFFFSLTLWLSLLVAESVMILIAAIVPMFIVGIAAGAFLFGGFMVVMGFFVRIETVPWPLRWMRFIGLHTYSFAAMVINEFEGRTFAANTLSFPAFPEPVLGQTVIESLGFVFNNKWANIGILIAMIPVYRLMAFLWIGKFHKGQK